MSRSKSSRSWPALEKGTAMRAPLDLWPAVGLLAFLAGFSLLFYGAVRYRTTVLISYAAGDAAQRLLLDSDSLRLLAEDERSVMAIHVSKQIASQIASLDGSFFWTFEALFLCSMGLIAVSSGALFIHSAVSRRLSPANVGDSVSRRRYGTFVVGFHAALFALIILVAYVVDTLRGLVFGTFHAPLFIDFGGLIALWVRAHWAVFLPLFLADYFFLVRALQADRFWSLWIWRDCVPCVFLILVLYCFCGPALFILHAIGVTR